MEFIVYFILIAGQINMPVAQKHEVVFHFAYTKAMRDMDSDYMTLFMDTFNHIQRETFKSHDVNFQIDHKFDNRKLVEEKWFWHDKMIEDYKYSYHNTADTFFTVRSDSLIERYYASKDYAIEEYRRICSRPRIMGIALDNPIFNAIGDNRCFCGIYIDSILTKKDKYIKYREYISVNESRSLITNSRKMFYIKNKCNSMEDCVDIKALINDKLDRVECIEFRNKTIRFSYNHGVLNEIRGYDKMGKELLFYAKME